MYVYKHSSVQSMERFQCEYSTTLPRCTIMVVSKKENQVVTQSVWTAKMGRDKEKKKKEKKGTTQHSLVSIQGPPGYEPGALPLRQNAFLVDVKLRAYQASYSLR